MFTEFWPLYPLKRDKHKAQKAFSKLSASDQHEAIEGVKREIEYRRKMAKANEWCPAWSYAQGWITGRRWEDELVLPEQQAVIEQYDPITDDLENLRLAQEEGHTLFANSKPCILDRGQFRYIDDPQQVSRQAYAFLKEGNTMNTGVTV